MFIKTKGRDASILLAGKCEDLAIVAPRVRPRAPGQEEAPNKKVRRARRLKTVQAFWKKRLWRAPRVIKTRGKGAGVERG